MNKKLLTEKYYGVLNEFFKEYLNTMKELLGLGTPSQAVPTTGGGGGGGGDGEIVRSNFSSSTESRRLERAAEAQEKRKKIASMQTRVNQEMSKIAKATGSADKYELRAKALDKLQNDADFVKAANEVGETVGKYSGYGNRGRFSYGHETQASADASQKRSREQLFDSKGRAKVFEKDPTTGKLIGRDPTDQEVADREQRMSTPAEEKPSRPRFSVGSGAHGQPVIIRKYDWEENPPITNVGGSYVNPLTPEGRLINQNWTKGSDGKLTPPDPEKDQFGYLNTPTGKAAALRDAKADTKKQYEALKKALANLSDEEFEKAMAEYRKTGKLPK